MNKQPINITDAAAQHLQSVLSNTGKALRVSINSKGCAGHSYAYELVEIINKDPLDIEIQGDWGTILLDAKSSMYLIGSTLDMETQGFNRNLTWSNPWAISKCGCGDSFSLKDDNDSCTDTKAVF